MTLKTNTLSPRLKSHTLIDRLFSGKETKTVTAYPVRVIMREEDDAAEGTPVIQVLFSVSKRHFKRAVYRNRVKRQMREIYRLNISPALTAHFGGQGKHVSIAFIWLADRLYQTADLARRMERITEKIIPAEE